MIRWKYLLPRLILITAIVLLVTTLSNPLSRFAIVHSLQKLTGAKVDIALVDVSPTSASIQLTDVQVADPNNPMRNLLQAGSIELNLDSTQALHRRLVVENAHVKQLQFGTPRIENGQLPLQRPRESTALDRTVDFAGEKLKNLGDTWAQQIQARLPAMIEDNLETVRVANELRGRWPAEFQKHRNTAASLRQQVKNLTNRFKQSSDNPLRDLQLFREALIEAQRLSLQFRELQTDVRNLTTQMATDRKAILIAHDHDREKILQVAANLNVPSDQLNELLLSEEQAQIVSQAATWLQRFRSLVPTLKQDLRPERSRGVTIPFRVHPQFVFRNLGVSGETMFGDRRIEFQGDINNLSESPKLFPEPVTFDIRGRGGLSLVATGTIDRRGPRSVDAINFRCPSIPVPTRELGHANTLLVQMQPSLMNVEMNVRIVDDQLEGQLAVRHSNVSLAVMKLHPDIGGQTIATQLNSQLANVSSYELTIDLSGTIQEPKANFESGLGEQFAVVLQSAFQSTIQNAAAEKTRQLDAILNKQLGEIQQFVAGSSRELLAELTNEIQAIASLQSLTKPGQLKLPRFR